MTSGVNCLRAVERFAQLAARHDLLLAKRGPPSDRAHPQYVGGQVDRAADVDAGVEQDRERAGEPCRVEHPAELAEDRQPQRDPVHDRLAGARLVGPNQQNGVATITTGISHQPIACTNALIAIKIRLATGKLHVAGDILEDRRELRAAGRSSPAPPRSTRWPAR